ncbi:MAG: rod shape-determining protein [Sarcina sp.]
MSLFGKSLEIGIDLGTANTLIYIKGKGIVLNEPSVVAFDSKRKKLLAVGNEAKEMIGRTPENIIAIRPLQGGVIADFDITQIMIKNFIEKAIKGKTFNIHKAVVCYPSGVTAVEKKAIYDGIKVSGVKEVILLEEPMAAAIGANLPVNEAIGNMIVDIGGGNTEVAVVSLGGIVTSMSLKVAGDSFDNAIIDYIKREYNLMIGERTAEDIKIELGTVYPNKENEKIKEISGIDLISNLPKTIKVTESQISNALIDQIEIILETIMRTLEHTPPELSSDIVDNGITLVGGGAYLNGLDILINDRTKIPVQIAESSLESVALGAGKVIEFSSKVKNENK